MSDMESFSMIPDDIETNIAAEGGDLNDELSLTEFVDTLYGQTSPLVGKYLVDMLDMENVSVSIEDVPQSDANMKVNNDAVGDMKQATNNKPRTSEIDRLHAHAWERHARSCVG